MQSEMLVGYLYQEDPFEMKTDKGEVMKLFKTYFVTADKKMITYYLKEKINLTFELPEVKLKTEFKPNTKGKLEMSIVGVEI